MHKEIDSSLASQEKKYHGFYRGIVIQNNDPDRGGKIKIFIPELMGNIFDFKKQKDLHKREINFKTITALKENAFTDKDAHKFLKENLPWASQLSPLLGSGSPATFRQKDELITTADVDDRKEFPNPRRMPGFPYQQPPYIPQGAHKGVEDISTLRDDVRTPTTDIDNNQFVPEISTNTGKGIFSIPAINSHVWVFFENGDWDKPIYFGYDHHPLFWREIYNGDRGGFRGDDYPAQFENIKEVEEGEKLESILYRNKTVFSSRAGSLAFVETDYKQRVILSHRNGSYFDFHISGLHEYVQGKYSGLINGDSYITVQGEQTVQIKEDSYLTVDEDFSIRVGRRDYKNYRQVRDIYLRRSLAFHNFREKRTLGPVDVPLSVDRIFSFRYISGQHTRRPLDDKFYQNLGLYYSSGFPKGSFALGYTPAFTPKTYKKHFDNDRSNLPDPTTTSTFKNIHGAVYGEAQKHEPLRLDAFIGKVTQRDYDTNNSRFKMGLGDPRFKSNAEDKSAKFFYERSWLQPPGPPRFPSNGPSRWVSQNQVGKWDTRSAGQVKSQATAGGKYELNPLTTAEERSKHLEELNIALDEIIKNDKTGGEFRMEVTRDFFLDIGIIDNDFPSIRVDPIGGLVFAGIQTAPAGSNNVYKATPLVEETGNASNFPAGNANLMVGNSLNIAVGTGGIIFKTSGVSEMVGAVSRISAQHLLELTSGGTMRIDCAGALTISADILTLRQKNNYQTALAGSVGIENNLTVGGSAIVNGELYVQHITAPAEIQATDQVIKTQGWTNSTEQVAFIREGTIIAKLTIDDCKRIVGAAGVVTSIGGDGGTIWDPGESVGGPVEVRAWTEQESAARLGVTPLYLYNEALDEFYFEQGTAYEKEGDRTTPALQPEGPEIYIKYTDEKWEQAEEGTTSTNSPAFFGTDRITAIELEPHAHQFKNLPLSLRVSPEDVNLEAGDVEQFSDIRGARKGVRHGKVLIKKYKDIIENPQERHFKIMKYLNEGRRIKESQQSTIEESTLLGKEAPSAADSTNSKRPR